MTMATISVSAVTGGGKTLLMDMIKQRLALVPGLTVRNEGEDVMVERMNVVYDVGYLAPSLNEFRDLTNRGRVWEDHTPSVFEFRNQQGTSLYMWADETENFAGFEDTLDAAITAQTKYFDSLNQPPKPPAEELPHYWQARTLKEDGRYKIVKVGKRVYTVTETFPGQEETPQIIHCGTHSNEAHTVFNALTRAFSAGHDAGGDEATDQCNELSCKAQAELREALAPVAVTVIANGVTHVFGQLPQDHAGATLTASPTVGTQKATTASGAPLAETSAHIKAQASYVWNAVDQYRPVVDGRRTLVDVKHVDDAVSSSVVARHVDWGNPSITHWRYVDDF